MAEAVFNWKSDSSGLKKDIDSITDRLQVLLDTASGLNVDPRVAEKGFNTIKDAASSSVPALEEVEKRLLALILLEGKFREGATKDLRFGGTGLSKWLKDAEGNKLLETPNPLAGVTQERLDEHRNQLLELQLRLREQIQASLTNAAQAEQDLLVRIGEQNQAIQFRNDLFDRASRVGIEPEEGTEAMRQFDAAARSNVEVLKEIQERLATIARLEADVAAGAEKMRFAGTGLAHALRDPVSGQELIERPNALSGITAERLEAQKAEHLRAQNDLIQRNLALEERTGRVAEDVAELYRERVEWLSREVQMDTASRRSFNLRDQFERMPGALQVQMQRMVDIEQTRNRLVARRTELEQQAYRAMPTASRVRFESEINRLTERRLKTTAQIVELQRQQTELLRSVRAGGVDGNEAQEAYLKNQEKLDALMHKQSSTEFHLGGMEGSRDYLQFLAGVGEELSDIQATMSVLGQESINTMLGDVEGLDAVRQYEESIAESLRILTTAHHTDEERHLLQSKIADEMERYRDAAQRAVSVGVDAPIRAAQREVGTLSTLLIGAFDGIGRRFITTLQFALSGGLLYAVQNLFKQFLQNAWEVERTFEDISTAFEFDIGATRGTLEFDRQISNIRRQTLALSEEFNTLPSEVNAAAYVMVARFGDSANALKALRAQLLAVKVSGIEQGEVLRSLTAVAEGFSAAVIDINSQLSLQEQLMLRERLAVDLYAEALDNATWIQQNFGIEVEDSLDGAARATATFSMLGFSLEQTMAMVAAVSRTLGQTGAQASEKLVRSIGQLTSPQIRDGLLEIAEASDHLFLTTEDFASGERAWRSIADQFDRFQRFDPARAAQFVQLLGQRRETEVIAALLGSVEMQQAMTEGMAGAAGAAQKRFDALKRTTDEVLKSIGAGFAELSQNLTELNIISPVSYALNLVDAFIGRLNDAAQLMEDIRDGLNFSIGADEATGVKGTEVRLGTLFQNVLVGAGTLAAAITVAVSAFEAFKVLNKVHEESRKLQLLFSPLVNTFNTLKGGMTTFSGAIVASGGGIRGFIIALRDATASLITNTRARIASSAAEGGSLNRVFSSVGGRLMASVTIIYAVLAGIGKTVSEFRRLDDITKEYAKSLADTRAVTQARIEQEGLEGPRAEFEMKRAEMQLLEDQVAANVDKWYTYLFRRMHEGAKQAAYNVDPSLAFPAGILGWATGLFRRSLEEDIEGTERWWRERLKEQIRANADAQMAAFNSLEVWGIPEGTAGFDRQKAEAVYTEMLEAYHSLQYAEGLDDEVLIAEAQAAMDIAFSKVDSLTDSIREGIEITVKGSQRIRQLLTDSMEFDIRESVTDQRADQSRETLSKLREELARQIARRESGEGNIQEIDQHIDSLNSEINENIRGLLAYADSLTDRALADLELGGTEVSRARDRVAIMTQRYDDAVREAGENSREANERARELQQAEVEARHTEQDYLLEQVAIQRDRASNSEASIVEMEKYRNMLIQFLHQELRATAGATTDRTIELFRQIQAADDALKAAENDLRARQAYLNVRRAGAILDPVRQAAADVARNQELLDQADRGSTEYWEAQLALSESQASLAQAQQARISAFAMLQAGVNNGMARARAELNVALQELALTARLFGSNSAEWANARLRANEAQMRIRELELEYADVNRRLNTDLSDPFQQAQMDLMAIVEKLRLGGMGPLERAQAELERAQAEIALIGARFNSEIFNLGFDFEFGTINRNQYIDALRRLRDETDLTTHQGKELWLQINSMINSMTDDAGNLRFNIPDSIRLPTLFEVRRAVEADQLGVNYQDNRTQYVVVQVTEEVNAQSFVEDVVNHLGDSVLVTSNRNAPGSRRLFPGGF